MRFCSGCAVVLACLWSNLTHAADVVPTFVFGKESPREWQRVLYLDQFMPQMRFEFSTEPNELVFFGAFRQVHFLNWNTLHTRMIETRLPASDVSFAPGRNEFLTAERTDGIALRTLDTGREIARLKPGPVSHLREAKFLDADTVVAYAEDLNKEFRNEQLTFWSMNERTQTGWPNKEHIRSVETLVRCVFNSSATFLIRVESIVRDGQTVARKVSTINAKTNAPVHSRTLDDLHVFDLSPDGRLLMVKTIDEQLQVIDLDSESSENNTLIIKTFSPRSIETAVFSPDGKRILTASSTARRETKTPGFPPKEATHLRLFDASTGEQVASLSNTGFPLDYSAVRFSSDGKIIAAMTRPTMRGDVKEALRGGKMVLWGVSHVNNKRVSESLTNLASIPEAVDHVQRISSLDHLVTLLARSSMTQEQRLDALYLAFLARYPTLQERELARKKLSQAASVDPAVNEKELQETLKDLVGSQEFRMHIEELRTRVKP